MTAYRSSVVVPSGSEVQSVSAIVAAADEVSAVSRRSSALSVEYEVNEYLKYHAERIAFDMRLLLANYAAGERILEVGAFPFILTHSLQRAGVAVSSVDFPLPEIASAAAALGISSASCNIETERLPFDDDAWDHVVFNEVFEHLRIDPIFTMREVLRVLKPGGRLWLSTPNLRSLRGMYNFLVKGEAWSAMGEGLYEMYGKVGVGGPAGHIREYTSHEVTVFLARCGFEIERVIYRRRYSSPLAGLACRLQPSLLPYYTVLASKAVPLQE